MDENIELNKELIDNKNRQRTVNVDLSNKLIEYNAINCNISNEKNNIRIIKKSIKKDKNTLKQAKFKIKKYNKKLSKIIDLYTIKDTYISLKKLASIVGNLDFLDICKEQNISIDKVIIAKKTYINITDGLYHVLFSVVNSDISNYKLFKNYVSYNINESRINIANANKRINEKLIELNAIKSQLQELKKIDSGINHSFKKTRKKLTSIK